MNGSLVSVGGEIILSFGFLIDTLSTPTTGSALQNNSSTLTLGVPLSTMGNYFYPSSGLLPNKTYYVRAYATNASGTGYGSILSFQTLQAGISTQSVTNINGTTASCGGNATCDGGQTIAAKGVVWSTNPNPTVVLTTKTIDGSDIGPFNSNLTGLSFSTTYYVRAYATNGFGTFYGNQDTFTTGPANLGDVFGGGKLAYILNPGDFGYVVGQAHGLIAAKSDQSTGIQWYNGSYITTGATGTAIGTGMSNTNAIVGAQGAGSYAAKICRNYNGGGYNDWYLPSLNELWRIYALRSVIGGFNVGYYSSSSETDYFQDFWAVIFDIPCTYIYSSFVCSGDGVYEDKNSSFFVRAVRSF